jgi:hypothetical protein
MARALAQRRSDESEVRHQDSLSGVVVTLAARSEVSQSRTGRSIEFVFAEIGNGSVSRLQGRAGGVEVARGVVFAVSLPIVQQQIIVQDADYSLKKRLSFLRASGQLNCVLCDGRIWAGVESQFARDQSTGTVIRPSRVAAVRSACLAAGLVKAESSARTGPARGRLRTCRVRSCGSRCSRRREEEEEQRKREVEVEVGVETDGDG